MHNRMKSSEKDSLVRQFQTVTQVDSKDAREMLRKHNWKIDEAIDNFFTHQNRRTSSNSTPQRIDRKVIENLFRRYSNGDKPDFMFAEEIIRFCADLKLDPTSLPVLVIAWKFKAKKQCVFTKSEFVDGMYDLGCDSVDKLRNQIPHVMAELDNSKSDSFKQLYRFTFGYAKDEGKKNLDIDTACAYWSILLQNKFVFLDLWTQFLSGADGKKRNTIPEDTWNVTLDFVNQISDLNQYDTEGAWPTLLDEFVEFGKCKEKERQQHLQKQGQHCFYSGANGEEQMQID